MKRFGFLFISIAIIFVFSFPLHSQMIADIRSDLETEFGTYHVYPVTITPDAAAYTIDDNLLNISNILNYTSGFSEADLVNLRDNYFFIRPTAYKELYDIYKDCKENEIPIFVTTDAMLHTFHIIYDYALRALEVQKFAADLDNLNKALLDAMKTLYQETDSDSLKAIVRKSVAYCAVATLLKDSTATIPEFVTEIVDSELVLIRAHEGFAKSPIFSNKSVGYIEDYSQYIPRGHYTRNFTLSSYFKSMMWYGRMTFRLEPDTNAAGVQKGREETLQAILIAKTLRELIVNGEPALDVWERIYDPTVFFVGKTDDLNIYDYLALFDEVYGAEWVVPPTVSDIADLTLLDSFIVKAKELRDPLINSNWVTDQEDFEDVTKGFRLMGQRFIPDSYMFQQLVYDKVKFYQSSDEPFTLVHSLAGPIRGFPRGLDVMAVLGSRQAEEIIRAEGDADYHLYDEQLAALKQEFAALDGAVWVQNLYWNWLYCLMPLLEAKGEGYPAFMQKAAWTLKQLYAALASWAELRHDTILYAKQSYTSFAIGIPDPPSRTYGYVEPNLHLYARLASLANLMRSGLNNKGLLLEEFNSKLVNFESLLLGLKNIAGKELTQQALLAEEIDLIWTIGERLENLITFSDNLAGSICDETDEGMAVVADVHTDSNTETVLEEGVGYPFEIYVAVKVQDKIVLTRGAGFSYYEFKHPMADRLTDEAWQAMLVSDTPPEIPSWTSSFIDRNQDFSIPEPSHAFLEFETVQNVNVHINPVTPATGDTLVLSVTIQDSPDSTIKACFYDNCDDFIDSLKLEIRPDTIENFATYTGSIATSRWPGGSIMLKILNSHGYYLSTYWFEIAFISGVSEKPAIPERFQLYQSYPNPFNSTTTICYDLPEDSRICLEIFNILGQKVITLARDFQKAGSYRLTWNGTDRWGNPLPSGVYIIQLRLESRALHQKLVLLK